MKRVDDDKEKKERKLQSPNFKNMYMYCQEGRPEMVVWVNLKKSP